MASKMRVTSLMDEARCYQALPITAKTFGHCTQDGTLDCRNEISSSPGLNCAKREGERNCGNMERAKGFEPSNSRWHACAKLPVWSIAFPTDRYGRAAFSPATRCDKRRRPDTSARNSADCPAGWPACSRRPLPVTRHVQPPRRVTKRPAADHLAVQPN